MTNSTEQILTRLFNGEHARMSTWTEQTQARAALCVKSSAPKPIALPSRLHSANDEASLTQLCDRVKRNGFALYTWIDKPTDITDAVTGLMHALGLHSSDRGVIRDAGELSLLQDSTGTPKGRFPPYQAKAMNWHTDGYYNATSEVIRCFTLHCVEPAAEGGALILMDDSFAVLALLRDDPQWVALLSHPDAMTLPHNQDLEGHDRPDRTLPMIYQNADESLSLRFTTRSQNIRWRCESTKLAALRATELIQVHNEWHIRLRLEKGQGVITRNILHTRERFADEPERPKRQMLRGRFTCLPWPASRQQSAQLTGEHTHATR
ncbi:MAG: TauD/TfdA family dioxygenase [Granulosicoccaceae bacterium]